MLKITMCVAGQKFPSQSLDPCMEADQSESTIYCGSDKHHIEQAGIEISDPRACMIATLCVGASVHVRSQGEGGGHSTT